MAAPAKGRTKNSRRTNKRGSATRRHPGAAAVALLAVWRVCTRAVGWMSRIDAPSRLQREILGVLAAALGALLALPLLGVTGSHSLLARTGGVLRDGLGRAAYLVPIACFWVAGEAFLAAEGDSGGRQRRGLGLLLLLACLTTFFQLIDPLDLHRGGGYLGRGLAEMVRWVAGDIGAGIIAFTVGIIGIYLFTGVDAGSIVATWRRARQARAARRAAEQASRPEREPARKAPKQPEPETLRLPPTRPVINLPKREPAPPRSLPVATPASELAPAPLPDLTKLKLYEGGVPDEAELNGKAELIRETLANFKVDAAVREISPGPAVTMFALQPGPGVKVRRITELQNDIALALAAPSIRIEAPVPGRARVGIELPNSTIFTVGLRETIESAEFQHSKAKLPLALGRDVNGNYIVGDLTKMPHLLIAGATGSGKSICINGIISTFLLTLRPNELQMVLIDPKMVELVGFNGAPHLKCPVVTEMDKVVGTLRLVLQEMDQRYQKFASLGVRNIDGYNQLRQEDSGLEAMPYLVVIIDELADLMLTTPEEVETLLVRLAQMARATGIHLLIATQRPSVDVITGLIKANVPARIAFAVTSLVDSKVVLDLPGAERLLGRGDMLFLPPDASKPTRVQGSFIEDRDLQYVVRHWRKAVPNHQYDPAWTAVPSANEEEAEPDDLMEQALQIVRKQQKASASMLQRRLKIGYNRAARLIEQMEDEGYVGPADGSRGRPVYIGDEE